MCSGIWFLELGNDVCSEPGVTEGTSSCTFPSWVNIADLLWFFPWPETWTFLCPCRGSYTFQKGRHLLILPSCRSSFVNKTFFLLFLSHNWFKKCDDAIFVLWIHMYYNFLFQTNARLKEVNERWRRDYSEYSRCEKNPSKVYNHRRHYWYARPIAVPWTNI